LLNISWLAKLTIINFAVEKEVFTWGLCFCVAIGLWDGLIIGFVIGYYTSNVYNPVQNIDDSYQTGAATNVIFGLALGYKSVIIPTFAIALNIYVGFSIAAMYVIAVDALGMLSTTASIATDGTISISSKAMLPWQNISKVTHLPIAIVGVEYPKSMRLIGQIPGYVVLIMWNSVSCHTSSSTQLSAKLSGIPYSKLCRAHGDWKMVQKGLDCEVLVYAQLNFAVVFFNEFSFRCILLKVSTTATRQCISGFMLLLLQVLWNYKCGQVLHGILDTAWLYDSEVGFEHYSYVKSAPAMEVQQFLESMCVRNFEKPSGMFLGLIVMSH
jgi:hypothetical protein